MKVPVFEGSSVAIVTPFRDGKVDYDALLQLIELQKIAGTAAITVCGTTGESSTISREEKLRTIEFVKKHSGGLPVIAGAGSNNTLDAVRKALDAQSAGADAILSVTPYYNKATQNGLIAHYTAIADAVSVPVILYNVPGRTGLSFTAETYAVLSRHENINGVKEASGNFALTIATRRLCGDELNIWSGNDDITVPMMALGAKGVISVAANVSPDVMAQMAGLAMAGKYDEASALQIAYSRLNELLFSEVNPIPVKAALSAMGLIKDELRLPLTPMSGDKRAELYSEMNKLGLI